MAFQNDTTKTRDTKRTLTVLLLRHGEREDEVGSDRPSRQFLSMRERIDPRLTKTGYGQASTAWKQILAAIDEYATTVRSHPVHIGVMSSPLRRCVGTSLMLSAAAARQCNLLPKLAARHGQPISWAWSASSSIPNSLVPIVIFNGLCYCAAAIVRLGGVAAIQQDLVACAARDGDPSTADVKSPSTRTHYLDNGNSISSSFVDELQEMIATAFSEVKEKTTSTSALGMEQVVQFVGRGKAAWDGQCRVYVDEPLSPPVTAVSLLNVGYDEFADCRLPGEIEAKRRVVEDHDDSFDGAMDQAARWAIDDELDFLVVVTHREGIRDMAERCSRAASATRNDSAGMHKQRPRLSTPYCCIGIFTVASDDDMKQLQWRFRQVSTYEEFTVTKLPS